MTRFAGMYLLSLAWFGCLYWLIEFFMQILHGKIHAFTHAVTIGMKKNLPLVKYKFNMARMNLPWVDEFSVYLSCGSEHAQTDECMNVYTDIVMLVIHYHLTLVEWNPKEAQKLCFSEWKQKTIAHK